MEPEDTRTVDHNPDVYGQDGWKGKLEESRLGGAISTFQAQKIDLEAFLTLTKDDIDKVFNYLGEQSKACKDPYSNKPLQSLCFNWWLSS